MPHGDDGDDDGQRAEPELTDAGRGRDHGQRTLAPHRAHPVRQLHRPRLRAFAIRRGRQRGDRRGTGQRGHREHDRRHGGRGPAGDDARDGRAEHSRDVVGQRVDAEGARHVPRRHERGQVARQRPREGRSAAAAGEQDAEDDGRRDRSERGRREAQRDPETGRGDGHDPQRTA